MFQILISYLQFVILFNELSQLIMLSSNFFNYLSKFFEILFDKW